jgi:hypothetical protein
MDNRIFNVNGKGSQMLLHTLELVFEQTNLKCVGWIFSKTHGLILTWHLDDKNIIPLPTTKGLTASEVLPVVLSWLESDMAKTIKLEHWDSNYQHDGSNSKGWRVYCEDWGHVADHSCAICAILPVFLWYGK